MTLWQKISLGRQAFAVWNTAEEEQRMGKSLLASKVFWANLIGLGSSVAGILPADYSVPALAILNVLLRIFSTDKPITSVVPQ